MQDLISRQAAIDAIRGEIEINGYSHVVDVLEQLPSALPEPIKINIEDFNKEDWERLKKEWRNTPITVLPAQHEIIRCKDCKHYYALNEVRGNCSEYNFVEKIPIDFCSWAERKEE